MLKVIHGQDLTLVLKIVAADTQDPYDFTGVYSVVACFPGSTEIKKKYLSRTGDFSTSNGIVSNTDTEDMAVGDLVTSAGNVTPGTKILTVDSPTQFTMDANALASVTAEPFVVGDIELLSPLLLGKIKVLLNEADTDALTSANFEVKVVKNTITSYALFEKALKLIDRFC